MPNFDEHIFVVSVPLGPVYTDKLRNTLESLQCQKTPVRVAICDAGNSSECKHLLDDYADILSYRRHGPDNGQSAAINEGWRNVEGDIYTWLNSDDYLTPDAFERINKVFLENSDVDIVYGHSLIVESDNQITGLQPSVSKNINLLSRHNIISQPSCFYRKRILDELGMLDENLHFTMDWSLWLRFYKAGKKFLFLPEIFSTILWEQGTKTSKFSVSRLRELISITRREHGWYTTLKMLVGFGQHHIAQYCKIGKILNLKSTKIGQKSAANFRDFDNMDLLDENNFSFPLYHYDKKKSNSLEIYFNRAVTGQIGIGFVKHGFSKQKMMLINYEIQPATIDTLNLSGKDIKPEDIKFIRIC